jgi:hypothetical protein
LIPDCQRALVIESLEEIEQDKRLVPGQVKTERLAIGTFSSKTGQGSRH